MMMQVSRGEGRAKLLKRFTVLSYVEPLNFAHFFDAQWYRQADDLEKHERRYA